jgi:hypothetical protein
MYVLTAKGSISSLDIFTVGPAGLLSVPPLATADSGRALLPLTLLPAAQPDDPRSTAGLDIAAARALHSDPQPAVDLAWRALGIASIGDPGMLASAVASVGALTAGGRLDQTAALSLSTLADPLSATAEARIRCALSTVLRAHGQTGDATGQADRASALPQLPHYLPEEVLIARLLSCRAGRSDTQTGPLAHANLADSDNHRSRTRRGRHAGFSGRCMRQRTDQRGSPAICETPPGMNRD